MQPSLVKAAKPIPKGKDKGTLMQRRKEGDMYKVPGTVAMEEVEVWLMRSRVDGQ